MSILTSLRHSLTLLCRPIHYLSIVGVSSCVITSCNIQKIVYSPPTHNLLQVQQKGDVLAAVNYSSSGGIIGGEEKRSNGIDLQSMVAVTDKVAVRLDGFYRKESNSSDREAGNPPEQQNRYKRSGVELSAGIYNFEEEKKASTFQLFAGVGLGKNDLNGFDDRAVPKNNYYSADYFKFFIQPSATFVASKFYTITVSSKLSVVDFKNVKTDYTNLYDQAIGQADKKNSVYLDFALQNDFLLSRSRNIKLQVQLGGTALLTDFKVPNGSGNFYYEKYDYNSGWLAIGLVFDMRKLFMSQANSK